MVFKINFFVWLLVVGITLGITSCKSLEKNVYVVGCEMNAEGKYIAMLWKNGVAQKLSDETVHESSARSVFVSGENVYIAGTEWNEQGNKVAILWKNDEVQKLIDETTYVSEAHFVFVSGEDVYVIGRCDGNRALWKNGVRVIYSVFVSNNDDDDEKSWENGDILYNNNGKTIYVSNNDVYVISIRNNDDVVQKLKPRHMDSEIAGYYIEANSVFVSEEDVYVAGTRKEPYTDGDYTYPHAFKSKTAVVWKNGVGKNLTDADGRNDTEANSVYVLDNDVYVVGNGDIDYKKRVAKLWINGKLQNLTDGTFKAAAFSVFVTKQ